MWPLSIMSPVDLPNMRIFFINIRVKVIVWRYNSPSSNNVHTLFNKDNITWLYFVGELPCSMSSILIWQIWIILALHCGLHFILWRILSKVAYSAPANSHYTEFIEFFPLVSIIAWWVNPIAFCINVLISKAITFLFSLACHFFLGLYFLVHFSRMVPCRKWKLLEIL